jgi:hypothetical protein
MKYILFFIIVGFSISCKQVNDDEVGKNRDIFDNETIDAVDTINENITIQDQDNIFHVKKSNIEVLDYPNGKKFYILNSGAQVKISGLTHRLDGEQWLEILFLQQGYSWETNGWIRAEDLSINEYLIPLELKFIKEIEKNDYIAKLLVSYSKDGEDVEITIRAIKSKNNTIFSFYWDHYNGSYYLNVPGVYIYDPNNNNLEHISYLGKSSWSGQVEVTSDLKYVLQDIGSSPGVRGLYIYEANTNEEYFSCGYRSDWNLNGYCIEVVESYGYYSSSNNKLYEEDNIDLEIKEFGERFIAENQYPEEFSDNIGIIIICEYNFITKERQRIIRGEYLYMQ